MDNSVSPISLISSQSTDPSLIKPSTHRRSLWILGVIFLTGLGITIGILGTKFLSQSQNQPLVSSNQNDLTSQGNIVQENHPTITITTSAQQLIQPISSPTPELIIPTADYSTNNTYTEKDDISVKNILYKKTPGWSDFKSNTGYSLQVPPTFSDADGSGEESRDGVCFMFFGNNAGGIISAKVVPYSGGSRRQLYGITPGYDYRFEEVLIQNSYKSLIIEAGPIGDSGSGTGIVIPVGSKALIVTRSNSSKDSTEFNSLLQSIALQPFLDINQCEK